MSGRWIDRQVLERLSRRAQGTPVPPRRELIADFCRTVGWRDGQGRLAISSASVGLRRLEAQGLVQLPPMAPRRPGAMPRGLRDDGEPLPPLPKLPPGGGAIAGLRLHLIENEHDPLHALCIAAPMPEVMWS